MENDDGFGGSTGRVGFCSSGRRKYALISFERSAFVELHRDGTLGGVPLTGPSRLRLSIEGLEILFELAICLSTHSGRDRTLPV